MEEPSDELIQRFEDIDRIKNLDTARATLRWALERVQHLQRMNTELAGRLDRELAKASGVDQAIAAKRSALEREYDQLRQQLQEQSRSQLEKTDDALSAEVLARRKLEQRLQALEHEHEALQRERSAIEDELAQRKEQAEEELKRRLKFEGRLEAALRKVAELQDAALAQEGPRYADLEKRLSASEEQNAALRRMNAELKADAERLRVELERQFPQILELKTRQEEAEAAVARAARELADLCQANLRLDSERAALQRGRAALADDRAAMEQAMSEGTHRSQLLDEEAKRESARRSALEAALQKVQIAAQEDKLAETARVLARREKEARESEHALQREYRKRQQEIEDLKARMRQELDAILGENAGKEGDDPPAGEKKRKP